MDEKTTPLPPDGSGQALSAGDTYSMGIKYLEKSKKPITSPLLRRDTYIVEIIVWLLFPFLK
jgi:hypothetical protein